MGFWICLMGVGMGGSEPEQPAPFVQYIRYRPQSAGTNQPYRPQKSPNDTAQGA